MKFRHLVSTVAVAAAWAVSGPASAALISVGAYECGTSGSVGIALGDVTAVNGATVYSAENCYGAVYGNDPGPGGQISTEDNIYDFLTKYDVGEGTEGVDIGLDAPAASSGTFTFSSPQSFESMWMVVLKASNCWAGWTFAPGTYSGGSFSIGFRSAAASSACVSETGEAPALSHISIYSGGSPSMVPEPGTLALLGAGLIGIGLVRRRMSS